MRPLHFGAALGKGDFRLGQPFGTLHGHFLLGDDHPRLFYFHFGQARRGRFRPCCFGSGLGGNGCLFGGAGLRFGAGQFGTGLGRGLNLQRFGFGLGLHPNGFGRLPLLHQRNFLHPLRFFQLLLTQPPRLGRGQFCIPLDFTRLLQGEPLRFRLALLEGEGVVFALFEGANFGRILRLPLLQAGLLFHLRLV